MAALDTMTTEIMLLGVATLFLSVIERSVGGACVPAKDLGLAVWADFVKGCACCLARTAGMTECFMRDRGCVSVGAVGACCDRLAAAAASSKPRGHLRGATCPAASLAGVVAADGAHGPGVDAALAHDGGAAAGPHRRSLLAGGGGSAAAGGEVHFCEGAVESGIGGCPPGRRPAISIDAMHQVRNERMRGKKRVRVWPRPRARAHPLNLLSLSLSLCPSIPQVHIFIFCLALVHIAASCAVALLASLRIRAWRHWDRAAVRVERGLFREAAAAAAVAAADAAAGKGGDGEGDAAALPMLPAAAGSDVEAGAARAPPPPARTLAKGPPSVSGVGGAGGGGGGSRARALVRSGGPSASAHAAAAKADAGAGGATPPRAALPDAFIPPTYLGPHADTRPWRGRAAGFGEPGTRLTTRAWEAALCLALQFAPNVVTKREWHLMRASFLDTHRVGAHRGRPFDFGAYTAASVDGDFASITGLGLPTWLILVGFVLLSSVIGWAVWVLVALAGALLLAVNWKLVSVVRHVTRGGVPHDLDPGAFWLGRPWLLLPAIKAAVFLIALLWANAIFFATTFGRNSCFFSPTGFQRGEPAPWWVVLLISVALFLILALNTMPMFSLTVQMGADVKADAIPEDLRAHFAAVGVHLAERRRARRREGGGTGGMGRLSRALSARLPRRADGLSVSVHGGSAHGGKKGVQPAAVEGEH